MRKILISLGTVIGAVIILIALYFIMFKAGTPAQGSMSYMKTGVILLLSGSVLEFLLIIAGSVLKFKKKKIA